MSESTTCSNCATALRAGAAFCTNCGNRIEAEPPTPPPPPPAASFGHDATQVTGPALGDATQVQPSPWTPPPGPSAGPSAGSPTPPPAPSPSQTPPPPPMAAAPFTTAPPPLPGASPPPPHAGVPTFGAPPAPPAPGAAQQWGDPAAQNQWQMPAPPAPGSSGESSGKSVLGAITAIIGGVLTGVGVFSGWVTLGPSGNTATDSMWSMVAGEGFLKSNDPIALIALAGGAFVVGILLAVGAGRTLMRIAAALIGLAIVVVAALNWMSISSYVTDNFTSDVEVKTAVGFYMVVVGGILTALSAILPAKK